MKILMMTSSVLPPREGIGVHVWELSQRLANRGHSVDILIRGSGLRWRTEERGKLRCLFSPFVRAYPFHVDFEGFIRKRFLASEHGRWDIIHAHSPLVGAPPAVAPLVTTIHTPLVVDARHAQERLGWGVLMKWFGITRGAAIERRLACRSWGLGIVSESTRPDLASLGVDPERARLVGNGVDVERFRTGPRHDSGKPPVILFVGRLAPRKQVLDAIRAVGQLASADIQARLHIVGEGPLRSAAESEITRLGLGDVVRLYGFVPYNSPDLPRIFSEATILIQPSLYEGLPGSVLQAMASGLPVVATDIPSHQAIICSGETGLLVPPSRTDALEEALARLLADEELRRRIQQAARDYVVDRHSWDRVADDTLRMYEVAIEAPAGVPGSETYGVHVGA